MVTFTTGREITSLAREYGISNVSIETVDGGATYQVNVNLEETGSLLVYEIADMDHAVRLAQKIADRFGVDVLLPSLIDEGIEYDGGYEEGPIFDVWYD